MHARESRLSVTLRPATSTTEKYELFRRYQGSVHKESEEKISKRQGFERFLCEAPFDVSGVCYLRERARLI